MLACSVVSLPRTFRPKLWSRNTYCHTSRSCDPPITRNADLALKEETGDGGDGSRLFNVCLTQLWPPSYPHPPHKNPSDTYRNTWLSRGSRLPRFARITLKTTK